MSQKPEATYHGADIVDRLDVIAPHSEDGRLLQEAAATIRELRAKVPAPVEHEARIEAAARALASMEPGEEWPTNEALGGNLTGTRDDEYRDAMREMAQDALAAADEATR